MLDKVFNKIALGQPLSEDEIKFAKKKLDDSALKNKILGIEREAVKSPFVENAKRLVYGINE